MEERGGVGGGVQEMIAAEHGVADAVERDEWPLHKMSRASLLIVHNDVTFGPCKVLVPKTITILYLHQQWLSRTYSIERTI